MFSLKIRYTLYGMILSASLITLVAQASTTDGVFGDYFRRMVGVCSTTDAEVITGFDNNQSLFGVKVCTTLTSLLDTIGIDVTSRNVGIGTVGPLTARLEVAGQIKIKDGSEGLGKVLTSDADGLASWSGSIVTPCVPGGPGTNNICHGSNALVSNSGGYQNVALGDNTLQSNIIGYYNTAIGGSALMSNITGSDNTAVGLWSLYSSLGSYNTAIGKGSLGNMSSGNYNTVIGGQAGSNLVTGTNNIAIGSYTDFIDNNGSNQLNIGNIIFGTGLTGNVSAPTGNVGIGTSTPTAKLEVAGNIIADTPTANNHVATKGYVDSIGNSLRTLPILSGATVGLRPVSSGEYIFSDSLHTSGPFYTNLQSVNNIIFAARSFSTMEFSTNNGLTWGFVGVGSYTHVAYGAGRYVFTPQPGNDNGGYTNSLTLPNTTVTNTTLPFSANYNGIAYGAGRFVVVAQGHTPINSTDGITWDDPGTGPFISGTQNITWIPSASLFIIQSYGSDIYHTSADGISWTLRHAPISFGRINGAYINGAYYAKEYDAAQWYKTTDGISWVLVGAGPIKYEGSNLVSSLGYHNGVYVMYTWNHIFSSTDFSKWIRRDEEVSGNTMNIISTNQGVFINTNGAILGSSDTVEGVFY